MNLYVYLGVALVVGGTLFYGGYKTGVVFTKEADQKIIDEAKGKQKKAEDDFASYQTEQANKLRELEISSREAARLAEAKAKRYQEQASIAQSDYRSLLTKRGETPAAISSSAVDSINSMVKSWESP